MFCDDCKRSGIASFVFFFSVFFFFFFLDRKVAWLVRWVSGKKKKRWRCSMGSQSAGKSTLPLGPWFAKLGCFTGSSGT